MQIRILIIALLLCSSASLAASVDDGLVAFEQGDYEGARDIWLPLAEQGEARAAYYMSLLCAQGKGVPKNIPLAMEYLAAAARNGHAVAQFNLGNHYNQGKWLEEKPELAAYWWRVSASQDMARAQHNLATLYLMGRGVRQDVSRAGYWYRRAAENGSQPSALMLEQIEADPVTSGRLRLNEDTVAPEPVVMPDSVDRVETIAAEQVDVPVAAAEPEGKQYPDEEPAKLGGTVKEASQDPLGETAVLAKPAEVAAPKRPADSFVTEPAPTQQEYAFNALGHDWVNQQSPRDYILQLLASESPEAVKEILDRYAFNRSVAVYRYQARGNLYYAIGYGPFRSAKEALEGASELPESMAVNNPWPRRFSAVQKLIK